MDIGSYVETMNILGGTRKATQIRDRRSILRVDTGLYVGSAFWAVVKS